MVYILHRRVKCADCRLPMNFCNHDAQALATLPTPVANQSPSQHCPGIEGPMSLMMSALMPHSVLFVTFANIINKLQHTIFSQAHISYLDAVHHWTNVQKAPEVDYTVPVPVSPFADQFGYGGVQLLESLVKGAL